MPLSRGRSRESASNVIDEARDPGVSCVVNLSTVECDLPRHAGVLLASEPLVAGRLPADAAVWLRALDP